MTSLYIPGAVCRSGWLDILNTCILGHPEIHLMMKQKRSRSFIGCASLEIDSNETNHDAVNGDAGNRRVSTICLRQKRSFSRIRASLLVVLPKPTSVPETCCP